MNKLLLLLGLIAGCVHAQQPHRSVSCDIVIAGGSTASLAAAITAAEAAPDLSVCFTEITDWPGGQMTAGGVPAIDFGGSNVDPANQPASFRDFFHFFPGNPGACSVSVKCYLPNVLVDQWIMPRLSKSKNLQVFLFTTIINTTRDGDGNIVQLTAVQRTAKPGYLPFTDNLSEELPDWYNTSDSHRFTKTIIQLNGKVFIEATELGDVLATSGLPFTQGIEYPTEESDQLDSTCGQAWTLTYYMTLLAEKPPQPQQVPAGSDEGIPFASPWNEGDWRHSWTWRRSYCAGNTSLNAVNVGDITQQNLLNDLDSAYLLLSLNDTLHQRPWMGGLNMTALRMLEGRAYGSYHYMLNNTPADLASVKDRIALDYETANTSHGLSKFPYLRDSRRAIGLSGYKLMYPAFDYYNESDPHHGYHFNDTIALGNYNDDTHTLASSCYPPYMANHTTKPYYIPLRALLVEGAPNMLVAGKALSQTFHANGATRLHPSEWTTGVAAGGIAVLMVRNQWTNQVLGNHVSEIRAYLNSTTVGQPLDWAPDGPSPPFQKGYTCDGFKLCIGTDQTVKPLFPSNTCNASCPALKADQWLANMDYWGRSGPNTIQATSSTVLKKSLAQSSVLPPDEIQPVSMNAVCTLISNITYFGYMACSYKGSVQTRLVL